jgi:hypothetical protein
VRAILLGDGTDVLDRDVAFAPGRTYANIRVVLTNRTATIQGSVQKPSTGPARPLIVAAIVDGPQATRLPAWLTLAEAWPDADGRFTIPDVRPGRAYLVAACSDPSVFRDDDPQALAQLRTVAVRVNADGPGTFDAGTLPACGR